MNLRPSLAPATNGAKSPIVVVAHGSAYQPALERLLARTHRPVVRVNTYQATGECVANLNEAFEFSGYQEGLGRVLRDLPGDGKAPLAITFVNDTLATAHPSCVAHGLLNALAWPPSHRATLSTASETSTVYLVGLHMPLNAAIQHVTGTHGYVSTWAFTLVGMPEDLMRVRFYPPNEVGVRFDAIWADLPMAYQNWVNHWLAPTHWFRGWYKACPGRLLDHATYRRKRLCIYLEHTLAQRLSALGFKPLDVSEAVGIRLAARLRFLRSLDRLNVNRLKLAYRLPHLLRLHS